MRNIDAFSAGVSNVNTKEEGFTSSDSMQGLEQNSLAFMAILNGLITQINEQGQDFELPGELIDKEAVSELKLDDIERQLSSELGLFDIRSQQILHGLLKEASNDIHEIDIGEIGEIDDSKALWEKVTLEKQVPISEIAELSKLGSSRGVSEELFSFQANGQGRVILENFHENHKLNPLMGQAMVDNLEGKQTASLSEEPFLRNASESFVRNTTQTESDSNKSSISNLLQDLRGEIRTSSQMNPELKNAGSATNTQKTNVEVLRVNSGIFPSVASVNGNEDLLYKQNAIIDNLDAPLEQNMRHKSGELRNNILVESKVQLAQRSQEGDFQGNSDADSNNQAGQRASNDIFLDKNLIVGQSNETSQEFGKMLRSSGYASLGEQIASNIFEKAFQTKPQVTELNIQLHPKELGHIQISLHWEDGQVNVRMIATEQGTGQILQSNLTELKSNLSQLGIQCGSMEMGLGNQQQNSQQQKNESTYRPVQEEFEEFTEIQDIKDMDVIDEFYRKDKSSSINVTA